MKKYLFLIAAMLNTVVAFAQFSGSGTGTESDPYLIYNENQLAQLGNFLNQEGVYFRLQKDLDMTDWIAENNPGQGWMPVGVSSSPFSGIFDGNNHKISGIFKPAVFPGNAPKGITAGNADTLIRSLCASLCSLCVLCCCNCAEGKGTK